jgi:cyanophycin synthetase
MEQARMAPPDAPTHVASNSLLEAEVVRVLSGASLYFGSPHVLVEIRPLSGAQAIDVQQDRGRTLDRLLRLPEGDRLCGKPPTLGVEELIGLLMIGIQRNAGFEVQDFRVVRGGGAASEIAVEHLWAPAAEMAMRLAVDFQDFLAGRAMMSDAELRQRLAHFQEYCSNGPRCDQRYLYQEARRRGIPVTYSSPVDLQFGHGLGIRRMQRSLTDRTSFLSVRRASDKTSTIKALQLAGLPVPEHLAVRNSAEAIAAARKIGFPVVVKPAGTDRGVGITAGVTTPSGVAAAYDHAARYDKSVAVERFIPGDTFRLLVMNGKFVAASRTEPTPIIGDGRQTIRDLVDIINSDPRRGPGHQKPLSWLQIDDEALHILSSLGLEPGSVLPFGRTIRLRTTSNLSRGGQSVAVTDDVHPDNRQMAEHCASVIGLDLAGVDFRSEAVDRSWRDAGGAVIEVNPSPGLRMHFAPARGPASDVATAVFDHFYPQGEAGRIPLIAVTGTNGKTTTTRMIAHCLRKCGHVTGRTTTEEAAVDNDIIMSGDCAGPGPARRILAIPHVEAAVLETARGGIIKYGLGYDKCDVSIVLNVEADHLGENGIDTLEELAKVKQVVAQSAERAVVLNADNEWCLGMRGSVTARNVILFSMSGTSKAVSDHVDGGGTAYILSGGGADQAIWRAVRDGRSEVVKVADLPITYNGAARHNIQNAMAALAALEQIGLEITSISDAAQSFLPTPDCNSGRLNRIDGFPFTVILDYAHNKHGFEAVAEFASASGVGRRRICVVTMNAARNDDSTAFDAMSALAGAFDEFVTCSHRAAKKRREGFGEVLRQGLVSSGVPEGRILVRDDEEEAIRAAMKVANPGDLVMILLGYEPAELLAFISSLRPQFGPKTASEAR